MIVGEVTERIFFVGFAGMGFVARALADLVAGLECFLGTRVPGNCVRGLGTWKELLVVLDRYVYTCLEGLR